MKQRYNSRWLYTKRLTVDYSVTGDAAVVLKKVCQIAAAYTAIRHAVCFSERYSDGRMVSSFSGATYGCTARPRDVMTGQQMDAQWPDERYIWSDISFSVSDSYKFHG